MSEYTDIMKHVPAFTRYMKCPNCRGTGFAKDDGIVKRIVPCRVCHGKRKLPIFNPDGRYCKIDPAKEPKGEWS